MKNLMWELFELIITLVESSISTHFVCRFLGLDFNEKLNYKYWYGAILCLSVSVITMNMLTSYEGIGIFIYCLVVFIYSIFLLPGTLIKKAFVSVFYICIIITNSYAGTNLVSTIFESDISHIYSESGYIRLITLIFVQILNLTIFSILEKAIGNKVLKLNFREWVMLAVIFFISVFVLTLIQIAATNLRLTEKIRFCFVGADLGIILVDYIAIKLIDILNNKHRTELENQQMRLQLQYQSKYAETVKQQEESVHKLRHDIKATISALYDLLHNENYKGAEKFLEKYSESLLKTASIVNTNQPFLNAILNTKLTYAKENGIICICHSSLNLPEIDDIDYCILLGNLLDNAIEYSLTSQAREIEVVINYTPPKLIITVKNKISNSILNKNPNLYTTKSRNKNRGYGISTIKEIAEKYRGSADFYEDSNWFTATIILLIK